MSLGVKAIRTAAAALVGVYVAAMMYGGAAYWIMRVAGYGTSPEEHTLRGGVLVVLSIVGLAVAVVAAQRLWRVRL